MELSLHLRPPSPSVSPRLFPSQFTPQNHKLLSGRGPNFLPTRKCRRRRYLVTNSASTSESSNSVSDSGSGVSSSIFGGRKELSGQQALVSGMSSSARVATSVVVVAGALAAGYALGFKLGGSREKALGGAVALGAAGGAAVYALNSSVPGAAAVHLHNLVASCDDPGALEKEDVEMIAERFGVSKQDEAFKAELCDLYSRFLSSVLPPENENLEGHEVDTIVKFKNALGIDDPDAASVHLEFARQIYRQRLETGDKDGDKELRRAFWKLVYVSNLVFGEASTFLLPWKRLFQVTDSQVEVAVRDNAQKLYAVKLSLIDRDINEKQLTELKEAQRQYQLSDEIAADMFSKQTRKLVEENISAAVEVLKSRTRLAKGTAQVIEELEKILKFHKSLIMLSSSPHVDSFASGVGPVCLIGGEYDNDRKKDDLKLLYRAYVAECLSSGHMEESKLEALNHLKNIFGLGNREAEGIVQDVTAKAYRKRLSQSVSSGDLAAATSKAAFLQNLCEELHFDPQRASEIHEDIYRQKLQQSVADGELSEEDVAALQRLRVMLCIPQHTIDAAHADICGHLFEKVVKEAIAAGMDGYDADVRDSVRKASRGLRLTRDAAMEIASKAVRKVFLNYIQRSRAAGSRTERSKELKKLIAFNTLVVTELVADIKGESTETQPVEEPEKVKEEEVEEYEWESLQTLRKTRPNQKLEAKLGKPSQTEITLKDDLPEREKTDLYKDYLLYCIQGEVTVVPFGAQITTKKDDSEYLFLNQLGGILGLSGKEILAVHKNLAEQAFEKQAEVILADGRITKAQLDQLNEVQKQVGLPAEAAQQIIKRITTTKMAAAIETAVGRGQINIEQIRDLKERGVEIDSMIMESSRENLFKKTVREMFSLGTGDFDEEEVYEKIPADLNINAEKAKRVVHEIAKARLSESLVQAIALLRQKKPPAVVSSLNDMLACDKAVPAETPLSWQMPEELVSLFAVYMNNNPPVEKLDRLQYLLGIPDSTVSELRDNPDRGLLGGDEEEAFVF
ncbi:hypothetical protein H6P81_017466 [Aristolochia fimbriata]|uniref:Protein TIC110, chloroplastic n=1 Tax=Aristolochia fimbriata TaxID=158543 RepID=A0AAV7E2J5_ARIFI|nr:hypothetical protein H6P81_017466 [Aristolochia fimbriata]